MSHGVPVKATIRRDIPSMNILLSFTDSYSLYAGVTFSSILKHCSVPVHFFLLSQDISQENKDRFLKVLADYPQASADFVKLDESQLNEVRAIYQKISKPLIHISTLYRLYAADILPESIDSVLYLDTDTLVRGDIAGLADLVFDEDIALYAVPDEFRMLDYHRIHRSQKSHVYFNAGVMLINLAYWRKHAVRQKCLEFLSENIDSCPFMDQDLLNAVCATKAGHLHQKYNFIAKHADLQSVIDNVPYDYFDAALEARENPIVVHYACQPRPWYKDQKAPYADEWMSYIDSSVWRDVFKPRYSQGSFLAYCWFWVKNIRKNLKKIHI